jgi:hypothetical protein
MTLILSGTDGLSDVDGTAAAPAIRGTDANTGIFFGADIIGFSEGGAEAMRIDSDGDVGIGTSSPSNKLHVVSSGNPALFESTAANKKLLVQETTDSNANGGISIDKKHSTLHPANYWYGDIAFRGWDGSAFITGALIEAVAQGTPSASNMPGNLRFSTNSGGSGATERMRIDSSGTLLVKKTSADIATVGVELRQDGQGFFTVTNDTCIQVNRLTGDGNLVNFRQDGTVEGTISVSGTTVSYNGGHLSRWAQTTTAKDEAIVKGTVLSNLDAMNVYTDADGNPVDNEQLNKVKVSDVEGDANVAGVFVNWTHDDAHNVDEINMAMTGDMIIRIAQGTTVARGDLLMSAGDGTAKPQGDDIVRSKTVAKVTSTHVTCTYADGSFCVPCVLMAC